MTEMTETLKKIFLEDEDQLNGSASAELHKVRQNAFKSFEERGIPTRKNEEYKYTDFTKIYKKFSEIAPAGSENSSPENIDINGLKANKIVFINGIFNAEQSVILDRI